MKNHFVEFEQGMTLLQLQEQNRVNLQSTK